jgi:hypothetical protein
MSMGKPPPLDETLARFERALTRLEGAFGVSVAKISEVSRLKGYEDGHRAGLKLGQGTFDPASQSALNPALNEELQAAQARENQLQQAVEEARGALHEAIDDIRAALGPL